MIAVGGDPTGRHAPDRPQTASNPCNRPTVNPNNRIRLLFFCGGFAIIAATWVIVRRASFLALNRAFFATCRCDYETVCQKLQLLDRKEYRLATVVSRPSRKIL